VIALGVRDSNWYCCTESGQVICFHPKLEEALQIAKAKGFADPILSFGAPVEPLATPTPGDAK